MGLDQHFYRHPMPAWEEYKDDDTWPEPILYFRKVNWLNRAFESMIGREVENCEQLVVTRAQLEEICKRVTMVLRDHEMAPVLLPTQGRFFFGSEAYDDHYFNDLKHVRHEFAQLLDGNADECFVYNPDW